MAIASLRFAPRSLRRALNFSGCLGQVRILQKGAPDRTRTCAHGSGSRRSPSSDLVALLELFCSQPLGISCKEYLSQLNGPPPATFRANIYGDADPLQAGEAGEKVGALLWSR